MGISNTFRGLGERSGHGRRVAELCRRTARALAIDRSSLIRPSPIKDGPAGLALTLAAMSHPNGSWHENRLAASSGGSGGDGSFESLVARRAEAILDRASGRASSDAAAGRSGDSLELVAAIFDACHEFDEAVEFAAYEQASIAAAIEEFYRDAPVRFQPQVLRALRQVTAPRWRPSLSGDLPVLPFAAAKLIRTSDEGASVIELERIAAADPVLAGRLLGAANSAGLGGGSEISDLRQAVQRLGVPCSRKVLLVACLGKLFASGALGELWKHSQAVAARAQSLAALRVCDPDVAWAAGLLHDIGRLLIEKAPPLAKAEEMALIAAGFPLVYAENLLYGKDHAALGGELLRSWKLPPEIVEAVSLHHRPESSDSVLAGILFLAEDDSAGETGEDLSRGMRRATAAAVTGLGRPAGRNDRSSQAFFPMQTTA